MSDVRLAWTLDSIEEVERDSEDRSCFTEEEAKEIVGLCAQLRQIVTGAENRQKKERT